MTETSHDQGWVAFRAGLERAIGVPLTQYKEPQLKRRLGSLMTRHRIESWWAFARAITSDARLLEEVRDTLTINVSEFFRQADRFEELRASILPRLMRERSPLRIWSAGCSNGCEPYTLSIILDQIDPKGGHSIIATDVDLPVLARAREGRGYLPHEVRSVPRAILARYFVKEDDGTYSVRDEIKGRVRFQRHDLLSDRYPQDLDLILCRNVVIYFTEEAKAHIYSGFAKALRPGGLLFVGGSEMIMRAQEIGFRIVGMSMYLKAA